MCAISWVPGLFADDAYYGDAVGRAQDGRWLRRGIDWVGRYGWSDAHAARVARVNAASSLFAAPTDVAAERQPDHQVRVTMTRALGWSSPLGVDVALQGGRLSVGASARVGCDLARGLEVLTRDVPTPRANTSLMGLDELSCWDPWVEARRSGDGRCDVGAWVYWLLRADKRAPWREAGRAQVWAWCHGPEVIRRQGQDARSWVFTVAAAVFRCITGRAPRAFGASDVRDGPSRVGGVWRDGEAERVGCPAVLAEVLEAALERSPEARPADLGRLVELLEPFAEASVEAPGDSASARLAWCRALAYDARVGALPAALLRWPSVVSEPVVAEYVWGHLGGDVERALGAPGGLSWAAVVAALVVGEVAARDLERVVRDARASVTARLQAARVLVFQARPEAARALDRVPRRDGARGRVRAGARAGLAAMEQARKAQGAPTQLMGAASRWRGADVLRVQAIRAPRGAREEVVLVPGESCLMGTTPQVDVYVRVCGREQVALVYCGEGWVEVSWGAPGAMCAPVTLAVGVACAVEAYGVVWMGDPAWPGVLVYGTPWGLSDAGFEVDRAPRLEPGQRAEGAPVTGAQGRGWLERVMGVFWER